MMRTLMHIIGGAIGTLLLGFYPPPVHAVDLPIKSVFEIIEYAQTSTCGPIVPINGTTQQLSAAANATIYTTVLKFIGLNAGGSAGVDTDSYVNVTREQLLALLKSGQECRTAVFNSLASLLPSLLPTATAAIDTLAKAPPPPSAKFTVWGTLTLPDKEEKYYCLALLKANMGALMSLRRLVLFV